LDTWNSFLFTASMDMHVTLCNQRLVVSIC
jgi:hypothetical protein